MKTAIRDMTVDKPLGLIISFSLPLMLGNVFQQLYTVVDTVVVGKALGVNALAALGVTDWLYWMFLGMIQGVTQGFGILIAREFGAKSYDRLQAVVSTSIVLAAVCAVFFMLLGQLITIPALKVLNTPNEIVGMSTLYLRIMFSGIPIVMAYNLLGTILRSLGDGRSPLLAMVIAAITNIFLDILFVLVFHWGIAGAAVATLISQLISAIYCYIRISKIDFIKLDKLYLVERKRLFARLLGLGMPMAAQNAIIAISGMIIQSVVNRYGVAFIGGFTASNKLYGVLEIAASSYGYAMITYVGQNLGAGKIYRVKQGVRCAALTSVLTSIIISTVMIAFGQQIVGMFISGTPNEVADATNVGYVYLLYMSICLPILYILHITRSSIQGMGNTYLPMISGVAEFIMRTGGVFVLPFLMGEHGIFLSEVLAWFGADLILVPGYLFLVNRLTKE